ncbi:unnamed protein product [Nesidiocoris tenuis]|uniref:Uncharacterized protein n=1 Tax=Nesidiocoris tenuis TaxID=355587 RepID=A0A6H5GW43_9HEMI|nr:unnamed protein product [Nesidiocoris tenuis]
MRITPPWRNILSYDARVLGIFLRPTLQKSSSWYFHPTDGKLTSQNSVQNPFKICDNHLARIKQRLCCEYGPITFAGSIGSVITAQHLRARLHFDLSLARIRLAYYEVTHSHYTSCASQRENNLIIIIILLVTYRFDNMRMLVIVRVVNLGKTTQN